MLMSSYSHDFSSHHMQSPRCALLRGPQASERLAEVEYLRNTILKYFELGPSSFEEIFPILAAYLEVHFSYT